MGKKKIKPNAYSCFVREFRNKEERAGRRYTTEEVFKIAKPYFDRLTTVEKDRYKQQAKALPARIKIQAPKYTSQGVPLEQLEREQREKAEKESYMKRKVKNMVENGFLDNDIRTKPFVFIMANYFYKTNDGIYSPAEVAVAKWCFEDGVLKFYHSFVNPETVAIGYAYEAKEHSERRHRLPPPPDALGEKNYGTIYTALLNVLGVKPGDQFEKSDRRRPCVFTRKEDTEMIESILDQLSDQQWQQTFDVFEFELLFNELKNKVDVDTGPIRITLTNAFIEQDRYDATPNISCNFHEDVDATRHCALSYVRRWFFLCADHVCEKIGVKLVPGKHLPINARLEPPEPFEDEPNEMQRDDDRYSGVASSRIGFQKFTDSEDSSDSE